VKKGAPFKGSQPKGNFGVKPKGTCFNCNKVGQYSKDCPKSKMGNGGSKVIVLNANIAQPECNRLIFLKGKVVKRDVLCLLDIGASHNFITVATLALGLRPRLRGSPKVTSHTLESVGKCEGVNSHTPKATPTLGDGVPVDF
jgi:hypothetical protein